MKITLAINDKGHSINLGVPSKVKKIGTAVKSVFTRAKGVKKPKAEDVLISTLQNMSNKLDNLANRIEGGKNNGNTQ
jgi:hypothetical protein